MRRLAQQHEVFQMREVTVGLWVQSHVVTGQLVFLQDLLSGQLVDLASLVDESRLEKLPLAGVSQLPLLLLIDLRFS